MKLGTQTADRNKSFQSLVFVLTQLHCGHWSSLLFCLPSLIVQWPARIVHFSLLRMIVKLPFMPYTPPPSPTHQRFRCTFILLISLIHSSYLYSPYSTTSFPSPLNSLYTPYIHLTPPTSLLSSRATVTPSQPIKNQHLVVIGYWHTGTPAPHLQIHYF